MMEDIMEDTVTTTSSTHAAASRLLAIPELLALIVSFSTSQQQRTVYKLRLVTHAFKAACALHFSLALPIAFSPEKSFLSRSQLERIRRSQGSIESLTLTPSDSRLFEFIASNSALAPARLGLVFPRPPSASALSRQSTPGTPGHDVDVYGPLFADGSSFARRLNHLTLFVLGVDWDGRYEMRLKAVGHSWDECLNHGSLLGPSSSESSSDLVAPAAANDHHPALKSLLSRLPSLTINGFSGTIEDRRIAWSTLGKILRNDCPRLEALTLTGLYLTDKDLDSFGPDNSSSNSLLESTAMVAESKPWWVYASLTSLSLSRTTLSIPKLCRLNRHLPNLHTIEVRIIRAAGSLPNEGPTTMAGQQQQQQQLTPLSFKKVTIPHIETSELESLLPLLERCTDLMLNHLHIKRYDSRRVIQAFKAIEKRNRFREFTIAVEPFFRQDMQPLLWLDCFERLESLTFQESILYFLPIVEGDDVSNNNALMDRQQSRTAPAFCKTIRRLAFVHPFNWVGVTPEDARKLFKILRRMPRLEYLYLDHTLQDFDGLQTFADEEAGAGAGADGEGEGEGRCPRLRELRLLFDENAVVTPELIQSNILDRFGPDLELLTIALLQEEDDEEEKRRRDRDEAVDVVRGWSKGVTERGAERDGVMIKVHTIDMYA
ncbi:hypothetical protein BGX29_011945 [Mortierella sp. GBA35]|nr:hypothetical protein BGX29_011945 [Mortierella sp. GBA35]